MIPVSDNVRKLLLQAVATELEQLRIEEKIPQADRGLMTDNEYATLIEQFRVIHQDLLDGRLAIFDTRPQCGIGECEAEGRYEPTIFVFLPGESAPCAQLAVQPPQRCCMQHADGRIDKYLTKPQWREIQAQVQKQTGQLIRFGDSKIMYMDHETAQIVPPPNPVIQIVN